MVEVSSKLDDILKVVFEYVSRFSKVIFLKQANSESLKRFD